MTAATWRPPSQTVAYPVLGVESAGFITGTGLVDIVYEAPDGSKDRRFARMRDIEVRPTTPGSADRGIGARHQRARRSIVRALTADFTDHSDARRCGCGARDSGFSRAQAVAQAGAGGAASATKPQE